jgi:hypothetical protein
MLTCYNYKKPFNKTLYDYCTLSTQKSIRNLTEKYNLERNQPKIKNLFNDDDNGKNGKPELNLYGFLAFLSISTIGFYIYKKLQ